MASKPSPKEAFAPARSIFPETLGKGTSYTRLRGRRVLIANTSSGDPTHQPSSSPTATSSSRAIAALFAREGAAVVCLDSDREVADATVQQIRREGGGAHPLVHDGAQSAEEIGSTVEEAKKMLGGRLDGLVVCGEVAGSGFYNGLCKAALGVMQLGGSVVVVSGMPGGASSADALVRAVACEGGGRGIRGNAIEMGGVDASRKSAPFGRLTTEWEIAYTALFLMSHESTYISGTTITLDGAPQSRVEGSKL
ncbi:hypothetical protein LTS18_002712 [Coniosporium uncinatum]|uniref:Uncharacterized protein n=1 Tax=Coniosporium uncinatum TaxID=93489 RepID=A0ACC3DUA6_9PEZI|nr:hypothetical protein LTS18_002712 [Coniosporium uncinatum]